MNLNNNIGSFEMHELISLLGKLTLKRALADGGNMPVKILDI
jgi:hypothetical protein